MGNGKEKKTKLIQAVQIIFLIMCLTTIAISVGNTVTRHQRYGVGNGEYRQYNVGWMLETKEGLRAVSGPGKVRIASGTKMVLTNILPYLEDGESLFIRSVLQDVEVYIDGKNVATYSNKEDRKIGKVSPSAWIPIKLTEEMSGREVKLVFESYLPNYAVTMSNMYIGDSAVIWYHLFYDNFLLIAEGVTILALGFAFIVLYLIGRKRFPFLRRLFYLGEAAVCIGGWILCNNTCRQLYCSNLNMVHNLSYILLMLMEIPLLLYVNEVQKRRYHNGIIYLCGINIVAFFGCIALVLLNIYDFLELFIVTECLLVASAVIIIVTSVLCMRRQKRMAFYYGGIIFILLAGVGEITRLVQRYNESYGDFLGAGTMIFLILTAIGVAGDVIASFEKRKRTEAENVAKNDFLSSMSHELRTPMHAISGMVDMMAETRLSVENRDRVEKIQEYTDNMLNIVNSILELSDVKSGELIIQHQEYPLQEVLYDAYTLGKQRLENKDVELTVELGQNVPSILKGDQARVKQIMNHLIHNAVKFTEKGSIRIKVEFETTDWKKGDLKIKISDTGCGIKEKDLNKIFKDFVKTKKEDGSYPEGSGIGLVICKRLVKRMKGKLEVESKWGEGSTFYVKLPQEVVEFLPLTTIEHTKEFGKVSYVNFKAPGCHILVVDDNETNLQIASKLLQRYECRITEASGGREALQEISDNKYDLVLLDIMMPEMDGLEVAEAIRKMEGDYYKKVPIIALTANAMNSMRTKCLEAGMNDYLTKPMRAEVLDGVLKQYLPKWKVLPISKKEQQQNEERGSQSVAMEKFLKKMRGINVEEGLHYCLDKVSVYSHVVKTFANQKLVENIRQAWDEKDIKNYTVWMHSLKSSAHNIGADKLSEKAYELEQAAKNQDLEYIEKENQNCLELYEKVLKIVTEALKEIEGIEEEETVSVEVIQKTEWKDALNRLADALMDMQPDEIKEAYEVFRISAPKEEKIQEMVISIHEDILNFDYEEAGEKINNYI